MFEKKEKKKTVVVCTNYFLTATESMLYLYSFISKKSKKNYKLSKYDFYKSKKKNNNLIKNINFKSKIKQLPLSGSFLINPLKF